MTTLEAEIKDCFPAVEKTNPQIWAAKDKYKRKPRAEPRNKSFLPRYFRRFLKSTKRISELSMNLTAMSHMGEKKPRSQLVTPKPDPQNIAMMNMAASARRILFLSSKGCTNLPGYIAPTAYYQACCYVQRWI
jgi:hypothetical protein